MTVEELDQALIDAMKREDWPAVDRLRDLLDALELDQHRQLTLLSSALWYAEQGLHVFPLSPRSKVPYQKSAGFKDATTDQDRIWRWWQAEPWANIGLATGHVVDVIDIDGSDGVISWARVGDLPEPLGTVSTPRPGGTHLYIPASGRGNTTNLLDKIDYRGLGGYVVAPPSLTDQGTYHWRRPLTLKE